MPYRINRYLFILVVLALGTVALTLAACDADPSSLPFIGGEEQPAAPTEETTATTPTLALPTPVVLSTTLNFTAAGLRLNYPAGWETRQNSTTLMIAPRAEAIDAPTLGEDPVIQIDSTPLQNLAEEYTDTVTADMVDTTLDTAELFETSSQSLREAGYTLENTTPLSINGTSGLSAHLRMEGGAGQFVMLVAPPNLVRVLGQAATPAWERNEPVFHEIVGSMAFTPPTTPTPQPTPTPANRAHQPEITTEGPPGFLLRLGGTEGTPEERFVSARGLATTEDGTVYLAESGRGIWVFAPDGTLQFTFGDDDLLLDAYDVAVAPSGDIFVADYGRNAIAHFNPDGTLVKRWGKIGENEEDFGLRSPQRIAVDVTGYVYALDSHISPDGQGSVSSIIRFNGEDGSFIDRIELSGLAPNDLVVDRDGMIYLTEDTEGAIVKINAAGQELARLGASGGDFDNIIPGLIDLDRLGNLYVATWNSGILKLAPDGTLITQAGTPTDSSELPQPGEFNLPNGIAVAPGSVVWVSDNVGEYSAITALRLVSEGAQPGAASLTTTRTITATGILTGAEIADDELLHQWAREAAASSSYGDDYTADNATGAPDVEGCTDSKNAWAPATPDTLETLELSFETPVFATGVNIYQNHQPGFVSKVEVLDERGTYSSVYTGTAQLQNICPDVHEVRFSPLLFRVKGVRLTVDQRGDANWAEIDAVELLGIP
jgi:sugar lactone lactonase YvrE